MFRLILSLILVVQAYAAPLTNDKLAFLIKSGKDSAGNPIFTYADSSNPQHRQLFDRFYLDKGVQKAIASHQQQQQATYKMSTPIGMTNTRKSDPLFIEIGSGTGTYNDWKGSFTIADQSGKQTTLNQSRIVMDTNDPMFRSRDTSLVEQTIAHETAHGIMRQIFGNGRDCNCVDHTGKKVGLPDSPWLGKPHYGDLVTDEGLAFIEGFAEFGGAYFTGRLTIAEDPKDSISLNAYAYTDNGSPKKPQDLFKTEGWVATVLYHISIHPSISGGYDKLLAAMRKYGTQNMNDLLKAMIAMYPETKQAISEILAKDSINQISSPLGEPFGSATTVAQAPTGQSQTITQIQSGPSITPPPVDVVGGTNQNNNSAADADTMRLFNDYQSSLSTLAQLKLDLVHIDWYRTAQWQEIQRRITFQNSLVQSLRARLVDTLKMQTGKGNQEIIAQSLLDNMEKLRFQHNQALQSYEKTSSWNQSVKQNLLRELELYQELYATNKHIADNMDQKALKSVWEQRMARMQYRVNQAQQNRAAAPRDCNANLDANCYDAYNKLVGAIEANKRSDEARKLLETYSKQ